MKITDQIKIANYQRDESSAFTGTATNLYLPENKDELIEIFKNTNENKTKITISGAGTGITGSRVPIHGGDIVSLEKITTPQVSLPDGYEIIKKLGFTIYLDKENKKAITPASIPLSTLDSILKEYNLEYPPDPTELSASLGGTVATNASGARSFSYGATREWVSSLNLILPTAEVLNIQRDEIKAEDGKIKLNTKRFLSKAVGGTEEEQSSDSSAIAQNPDYLEINLPSQEEYPMPDTKNAAGLFIKENMDLVDLFISSEGILACFLDIEVNLIERNPKTLTTIAYFDSENDALDFVDSGIRNKNTFKYLSLEFFDHNALALMRKKYPDLPEAQAAILFEIKHNKDKYYPENDILDTISMELKKFKANANWAVPYKKREEIRIFRHSLPEAVNDFARKHFGKIGTDMAVPHEKIKEMMQFYHEIATENKIPYVIFGHIGSDHVHMNFLPESEEQAKRAKEIYTQIAQKAVEFQGTVSAEHGVGKKEILINGELVPYLEVQYGKKGLEIISNIKKTFDPNLILNVGNMV